MNASLAQFGRKVICYDVFFRVMEIWEDLETQGIMHVEGEFCDVYNQLDWDLCVEHGEGNTFYWMQYLITTTCAHSLTAEDMYAAFLRFFDVSSNEWIVWVFRVLRSNSFS
jgi:hypothetical protein